MGTASYKNLPQYIFLPTLVSVASNVWNEQ